MFARRISLVPAPCTYLFRALGIRLTASVSKWSLINWMQAHCLEEIAMGRTALQFGLLTAEPRKQYSGSIIRVRDRELKLRPSSLSVAR
jgi:hypothetical protein